MTLIIDVDVFVLLLIYIKQLIIPPCGFEQCNVVIVDKQSHNNNRSTLMRP